MYVWQARLVIFISDLLIIFCNSDATRFGDLRAVQTLFSRFGKGRLGMVISDYHLNME